MINNDPTKGQLLLHQLKILLVHPIIENIRVIIGNYILKVIVIFTSIIINTNLPSDSKRNSRAFPLSHLMVGRISNTCFFFFFFRLENRTLDLLINPFPCFSIYSFYSKINQLVTQKIPNYLYLLHN